MIVTLQLYDCLTSEGRDNWCRRTSHSFCAGLSRPRRREWGLVKLETTQYEPEYHQSIQTSSTRHRIPLPGNEPIDSILGTCSREIYCGCVYFPQNCCSRQTTGT